MKSFAFISFEGNGMPSWRLSFGSAEGGVERKLGCNLQSISSSIEGRLPENTASWQARVRSVNLKTCCKQRSGRIEPSYSCVWITAPESSNTRIIARCEQDKEWNFAYATALRTASGPAYQIGPCRSRSL